MRYRVILPKSVQKELKRLPQNEIEFLADVPEGELQAGTGKLVPVEQVEEQLPSLLSKCFWGQSPQVKNGTQDSVTLRSFKSPLFRLDSRLTTP